MIRPDVALLASVGVTAESVAANDTAEIEQTEETTDYLSPARVLLIGSGADEQFGGTLVASPNMFSPSHFPDNLMRRLWTASHGIPPGRVGGTAGGAGEGHHADMETKHGCVR